MTNKVVLSDPTLRDGSHAVRHQISLDQVRRYARAADLAGIDIIEVGHGNGLGASSCMLGESAASDREVMLTAVECCKRAKVGIHFIPGFGKMSDLEQAVDLGVGVLRIASHCTEANTTSRYIEYASSQDRDTYGVLMMSHMADAGVLLEQARHMQSCGAGTIILMDSAGAYTPDLVREKVDTLLQNLDVAVGFHAHNNLGMAIANTIAALQCGASVADACSKAFGAGAGNTQLEVLVAVLEKYGFECNTSFHSIVPLIEVAESVFTESIPDISTSNIASGMYGLFSGFATHVERAAQMFNVDKFELYKNLASRKLVAGQEDIIVDEASRMSIAMMKKA